MKTAIITGITGQDGAYLSNLLLLKGYKVVGLLRSSNSINLFKLKYLNNHENIILEQCDLNDITSITKILVKYNPDEVYNLAAQSSVGLSFSQPIGTIQSNLFSVLNLLESIKNVNREIRFYQASSSEMFGNVKSLPLDENTAFHPTSPYGISKASAHWTVINYRESFGMYACSGILFNHESYLRNDYFFVKKVIRESLNIKNKKQDFLRVGNIDIKRDFGYAPKYVEAIYLMLQQDKPEDFIICSGKSIYLRDIIYYVFDKLNISKEKIQIDDSFIRPVDISDIYGDNRKAKKVLGWQYDMDFFEVLDILINEEIKNMN
jgi:GDPmannose 4,6-dehydratase